MKKSIYKLVLVLCCSAGLLTACSLEEYDPSTETLEKAYSYPEGYKSLINSCYMNLYYIYGKIDGIGPLEMGCDLWINSTNAESTYSAYQDLNTSVGSLKTIWQSLYATVNLCNTAIALVDKVKDLTDEQKNQLVAEAYFLRGWAYFHLVEQFGGVVLTEKGSAIDAVVDNSPKRSEETAFYDLIIKDLQFSCTNLPITQNDRGRASRKAAYAMLAKACLQRTRLGDKQTYAKMALDAAQELINNPSEYNCSLYTSDDNESGFAKLWKDENNKNNSEFLFVEAIDASTNYANPEGTNRGRTRQYYLMDLKGVGSAWGTQESDTWLGRANSRSFKPTKYLMTGVFDPSENTPDTRYANTFIYKYYNASWGDKKITQSMINTYGKDPSLLDHVILNTAAVPSPNTNIRNSWKSAAINMEDDKGLSVFTPNWTIAKTEKALIPCLVADPSDMFNADGTWTEDTQMKEVYPSMSKYSGWTYCYDRQCWMGDFAIIRLGEVYLIAAEAALLYNQDKTTALSYVNDIRKRAALKGRENEMLANESDMTVEYILEERARELAGEHLRWYDLKRTGNLTKAYLARTNPDITLFDETKHFVRPIPVSFLNAIANPDEFGTNGY